MRRRGSLYWRLLVSYVLVIAMASVTFWLAGQSFAPFFLERHVNSMMRTAHNLTPETMQTSMTTDLAVAYRQALSQSFLWAVLVAVAAAGAVALYVSRRVVIPLKELRRAAGRIAAGRYEDRLDARVPGEVGDVADAFNAMAETLSQSEARRVDLLANVAHEFRTPLSNLNGYIEGLEDGVFAPDASTLNACKRQLERLGHLVDDLSLLSRVESGQEVFAPRTVPAGRLLEQAATAFRPQFDKKGVGLEVTPCSPKLSVRADAERSGQILANLLGNALRHTPPGGLVRLSAEPSDGAVRFSVTDTGEGIAEADLPHVFTRFFRADKARGRETGGGSGIGLTIVRHYAERQGGEVGAESEPGRGSRFWFTLPRTGAGTPLPQRTDQDTIRV